MSRLIADVVIDGAFGSYDNLYSYVVPESLEQAARPGCRVTVPFGRGNVKRQGMIFALKSGNSQDSCKAVFSVTDKEPVLNEEMLALCKWMRERTFCTYSDAIHTMLPAGLNYRLAEFYSVNPDFDSNLITECSEKNIFEFISKKGTITQETAERTFPDGIKSVLSLVNCGAIFKTTEPIRRIGDFTTRWVRIKSSGEEPENLSDRQREIYDLLLGVGEASIKEIKYFTGVSDSVINTLKKKGLVEIFEKEEYRLPYKDRVPLQKKEIMLTPPQERAYTGLKEKISAENPGVSLLYGVTGSGKTQVFLKLADDVSELGKGVIIMVPEIALTPQMISLFTERYGDKVAVFHSAMSLGRRMDEFKRIKNGDALIAVGTRSAVFAPFKDIGLIVIDEEQEHTYKSERAPRYDAREVAKFRAAYHKSLLCLSSATPSIESYSAALGGKYGLFTIKERYGAAKLPEVTVVDMRKEILSGNSMNISTVLAGAISEELQKKNQVVLLLNRRGHNTYVSCPKCGWVASCPNCSISLTYHSANRRLMCHYCGYSQPAFAKCPDCSNDNIAFFGAGTQKLEEELKILFPDASVLRMDADSTMSRNSYSENLTDFSNRKYDILLGTQMVAKGLDFPAVTLVGVVGADRSFYSDDYRSFERTFSLLTQVVGRAGRSGGFSRAVIQTFDPENSVISLAKTQDYDAFYHEEIMTRKLMTYPPFCDICMIAAASADKTAAEDAVFRIFGNIKTAVSKEYSDVKIMVLGPCAASVPKVSNRYRYRMIIKCRNSKRFRDMIRSCISIKPEKDTVIFVDINPENVL